MVKRIAPENNPAPNEGDFERALRALRHADPRIRYRAVAQLGRLGDRRALRHLAAVYRTDPDSRVRAAAARVGQAIHDAAPRQNRPETAGTARAEARPARAQSRRLARRAARGAG
ncbi:MAG: HEAT repeat domain-containing protein [Anaerolineae bacterium]|nr:HEAT repeat domain-containing protein [Anaerolineae bacterium]